MTNPLNVLHEPITPVDPGHGKPIVMTNGRIGHAELAIGNSVLMLADEFSEIDKLSPQTRSCTNQLVYRRVSVPDAVDATVREGVKPGTQLKQAAADNDCGRNTAAARQVKDK